MRTFRAPFLATAVLAGAAAFAQSDAWDYRTVTENANRVEARMLAHPIPKPPLSWENAALFSGYVAWGLAEPNRPGIAHVRRVGRRHGWGYIAHDGSDAHMANNHAVGIAWLDLAMADAAPARVRPARDLFDFIIRYPSRQNMDFVVRTNWRRWNWIDALFMSPPVLARLHAITGERRYRDFLVREWRATMKRLYDPERRLFVRDSSYLPGGRNNRAGRPVFWSRGNGWVYAGLAMVLRHLPADDPDRVSFETLFRDMSAALRGAQTEDGSWHPNLADPADGCGKEMSGTLFFTYGMLCGLNAGLLDPSDYRETVRRAWTAVCGAVNDEGRVGCVQVVADGPAARFTAETTETYAVGAYLLASAELRKLIVRERYPNATRVRVTNPWRRYRPPETLELSGNPRRVFDLSTGAILPQQEHAGKTLVSVALAGCETRTLLLLDDETLPAADGYATCRAQVYPKRAMDFGWENDRFGMRAYGPKDPHHWSGLDVFNKATATNLVACFLDEPGKWGNWHKNARGLGMDDYAVGPGRGVGGVARFHRGRWLPDYGDWVACDRMKAVSGPVRCEFELTYRMPDDGSEMSMRIRLDRGQSVFSERISFDRVPDGMEIGAFLDVARARRHDGDLKVDPDAGVLSLFERPHNVKGEEGSMMTALAVSPDHDRAKPFRLRQDPTGALGFMCRADGMDVLAGAAWTEADQFACADDWHAYVRDILEQRRAPLRVQDDCERRK